MRAPNFQEFKDLENWPTLVAANIYILCRGEFQPPEFTKFNGCNKHDPTAQFAKIGVAKIKGFSACLKKTCNYFEVVSSIACNHTILQKAYHTKSLCCVTLHRRGNYFKSNDHCRCVRKQQFPGTAGGE